MFWEFADSQHLIDAIISRIVPPEIVHSQAEFVRSSDGRLWVKPAVSISRELAGRLRKQGARSRRQNPPCEWQSVSAWWEILNPCQRPMNGLIDREQPVLLQIPRGEELSRTMREIPRLGGRLVEWSMANDSEQPAFLRVLGLPYFSWRAAVDGSQRVFAEHGPGLWIEAGYSHPLAEQIRIPEGRLILLAGAGTVISLETSSFRTIPEARFLPIRPDTPACFAEPTWELISLPFKLAARRTSPSARLWIVTLPELQNWIQEAGQALCEQLAVAVIPRLEKPEFLVRSLKGPTPPVLIWNALGLAPSPILPGLYVPLGYELQPVVRPEVLSKALGDSRERLSWITLQNPNSFRVHSVSQSAFRPLADCIDYLLDRPPFSWKPWSPECAWLPEPFEIWEQEREQKPKAQRKIAADTPKFDKSPREHLPNPAPRPQRTKRTLPRSAPDAERIDFNQQAARERLAELEQQILSSLAPFDDAAHHSAWREMADLHFLLRQTEEGMLCLSHALWDQEPLDAASLESAWRWTLPDPFRDTYSQTFANDWLQVRQLERPTGEELSHLALGLVWLAASPEDARSVRECLGELLDFLKRFENDLPLRTAWLAWWALSRIASGDVLTLARARDRFLERLFQRGIRLERDCPRCLRRDSGAMKSFQGQAGLAAFRPVLHKWSRANCKAIKNLTPAYIDLILAFGLARQGHTAPAKEFFDSGRELLQRSKDPLHQWCLSAYEHRIQQALQGHYLIGSLSPEILTALETFSKRDRFKLDRLRQASQILEPARSLDSFVLYHQAFPDDLARELARLNEISDSAALAEQFRLLKSSRNQPEDHFRLALAGLELAPRMGLMAAQDLLMQAAELQAKDLEPAARIQLLESSLRIAAHFDLSDRVQALVDEFCRLLEALQESAPETVLSLENAISQSFQGLRRFGLHAEILRVLDPLEVLAHQLENSKGPRPIDFVKLQKLLLQIVSGRFFFGQDSLAWPMLDRVRGLLQSGKLSDVGQVQVAQAYVRALGFAPPGEAGERLGAFFHEVRGLSDAFSTSSHFFLSQLSLAEALVFALAGDINQWDQSTRRLLDEEEYRVRKRIHRDLREAMDER